MMSSIALGIGKKNKNECDVIGAVDGQTVDVSLFLNGSTSRSPSEPEERRPNRSDLRIGLFGSLSRSIDPFPSRFPEIFAGTTPADSLGHGDSPARRLALTRVAPTTERGLLLPNNNGPRRQVEVLALDDPCFVQKHSPDATRLPTIAPFSRSLLQAEAEGVGKGADP